MKSDVFLFCLVTKIFSQTELEFYGLDLRLQNYNISLLTIFSKFVDNSKLLQYLQRVKQLYSFLQVLQHHTTMTSKFFITFRKIGTCDHNLSLDQKNIQRAKKKLVVFFSRDQFFFCLLAPSVLSLSYTVGIAVYNL